MHRDALRQDIKIYKSWRRQLITNGDFSLSAIQVDQIEKIRLWRNAQKDVLRQSQDITRQEQETYFNTRIWPYLEDPRPRNILLSLKEKKALIGYGGLVHIAWQNSCAEVSFLLNPKIAESHDLYPKVFEAFLCMLEKIAFQDLKLNRLFTETYSHRTSHILVLEKCGFIKEGTLRQHVLINNTFHDSIMHGKIVRDSGE